METYTDEIMSTGMNMDDDANLLACEATGEPNVATFNNPYEHASTDPDGELWEKGEEIADANAEHAAECWNACKGINPKSVPGLLVACQAAARICRNHAGGESNRLTAIMNEVDKAIAATKA